ncbi:expressed unknown protein [Seminavis robusta]|uniref:Uncharacterized protein n=1 Tax=Seminavis robusta TaxID=568900 RepID=A0A9N8EAX8_9STRA|nr:expressed unknown protein [Seminavis robusta]|eukprot:Sro700_g189680.1 n/a (157) ;mRNA; r:39468-39938
MTTLNNDITRASTPTALNDEVSIPCTPPHSRIPMFFPDAPMAPRPRKRVFQPSHFLEGELDHLLMPIAMDEAPELVEETPTLTCRPAPAHVLRHKIRRSNRRPTQEDDNEDVVRISFRNNDESTKENATGKLWDDLQSTPPRLTIKRRNSYNAQCA